MEKFKTGEVVSLKSGSPPMTVQKYVAEGRVLCTWYEAGGFKTEVFEPETLVKI